MGGPLGGDGPWGVFQESFFRRFSKSIEKVAVPATADTFFTFSKLFDFRSFPDPIFPNLKKKFFRS